ncbi:ubiquitin-activating E1 FCCH domain-containing protein [Devosia sp. YIM 151766]|uniref:TadE/TadG family type IV pilus assembly protein n=1 Tax=Devosia sp. YIM 151766 TaxID=3017325 RepID=UPI00255CFED7|nr:TadE/TadG family type IV pilus assembly protein [Devosia sp. YIM 151766]WIY53403.1 ubiquitin-activating E1 FCCH domain-containing protein [Devosia sp. YIM 151766]
MMSGFTKLLRRFGRDESGVFAVVFGVMAIVLVALGGAVVDYVTLEQTRARAQTALDAAVLALQPEINLSSVSEASILERAEAIVRERIGDPRITARVDRILIEREAGRLFLGGDLSVPTMFVSLVGVDQLGASFSAEAMRGSVNLEVAVALDVTGSMSSQDMRDLRTSVSDLVDTIVQDSQEPTYSKVALVPYSQAVNAGTYADRLRGPLVQPKDISRMTLWAETTIRNISAVSTARNSPVTITSSGHNYQNNDWVFIWEVSGTTQLNGRAYQVTERNNNSFQLRDQNGNNYSTYRSGGKIRKCSMANCQLQVTANGHGHAVGDWVHITDVAGMTGVNNVTYQVTSRNANTLTLSGLPRNGAGNYSNNTGKLHCTDEGCTYFRFQSRAGSMNVLPGTTCVTERALTPYDLPPSTTLVGRNYAGSGNGCLTSAIVPLTANKTVLRNTINALSAAGSTSGSLGILWTWYMLAPNFGYVWPFDSRPGPYNDPETLKAAIIMTDGEFNTVHCRGVVARNSTSGSGGTGDQINCAAPNGDPYPQARAYCDAMKGSGVEVYTVGFNITSGSNAAIMLNYCASSAANSYLASNGGQMREAFQQIARNISALRLTR